MTNAGPKTTKAPLASSVIKIAKRKDGVAELVLCGPGGTAVVPLVGTVRQDLVNLLLHGQSWSVPVATEAAKHITEAVAQGVSLAHQLQASMTSRPPAPPPSPSPAVKPQPIKLDLNINVASPAGAAPQRIRRTVVRGPDGRVTEIVDEPQERETA